VSRRASTLLALAVAALVGCGGQRGTGGDAVAPAAADGASLLQQAANGPLVAPTPGRTPLTLRLVGGPDPVVVRFKRPARSGILFDLDTGQVLWRRDPERVLPIASLTKMMTALVVVDSLPEGTKVRVTKEALSYRGSGVGVLPRGREVGLSAMLHGLLLPSGNDASIALAQRTSGTVTRFVQRMNDRAAAMHLACSRFSTPSGIRDTGNHSCAADLAALARAVLDEPRLARIVRRRQAALPFPIKGGRLFLNNNNPLLRHGYPGTLGIKTGFTDAAGRCIVAAAHRGGRRLGVVLLHSPDPGRQAEQLLDRGFQARH
jgi:D-alanyl-D-alanine carboxypeptidase